MEIARLLNEHKGEKGMASFISKDLKVSGKDVGKVKRMMDDGLLIFDDNEPRLIVPRDKFEYFLLGKVFVEWAAKRKIKPQGITDNLIDEVVTKALDEYGPRKPGRPNGSSIKPQLKILYALMDGSKSFQGIVDATKLPRNTVANNLKILASMGSLTRNLDQGKPIYLIDLADILRFFKLLALKGNIKAKKAVQTALERMKHVRKLLRYTNKYFPEILECLSDKPELINRDFYQILNLAMERYELKREKYSIEREKPYLPSHHQKQVKKIREACLSLGKNVNMVMESLLKTLIKTIMETEDIKRLILSDRVRYLGLE